MDAAGVQGFVRAAALDLPDARRIVVHPPLTRETAIQMGMDGAPWPSVTTVAQTYFKALERKIMGQPVYVEGYGPSRGITAFPVYPTEPVPTVRQNTGRRDCVSAS